MNTTLALLNTFLPLGYLAGLLAYLGVFTENKALERVASPLTWGVVLIHAAYLMLEALAFQHVPVANTWEGLTFIAFAVALVYLVLEWRLGERSTGVFALSGSLLLQILSSAFIDHTNEVPEILRSPMFAVHVTTALTGYVALAISALYGLMYLLQYRQLKQQNAGVLFQRLPDLETLSRLNIGGLALGWIGLTVAILAGMAWATTLQISGQLEGNFVSDPKFLLTVALWVLYGLCLAGRYLLRWANRTLATASIVGFILMLASSVMVTLVLPTFHDFS